MTELIRVAVAEYLFFKIWSIFELGVNLMSSFEVSNTLVSSLGVANFWGDSSKGEASIWTWDY